MHRFLVCATSALSAALPEYKFGRLGQKVLRPLGQGRGLEQARTICEARTRAARPSGPVAQLVQGT